MLTNSQKKQLRGLSSTLKIKYQIGKNGLTDNVYQLLENALKAHELIKIEVLKGLDEPLMEIALDLSAKLKADIVHIIGRSIVLFKDNPENGKIKLVK